MPADIDRAVLQVDCLVPNLVVAKLALGTSYLNWAGPDFSETGFLSNFNKIETFFNIGFVI